jgi:lipopolysaccharide export system protein LptA
MTSTHRHLPFLALFLVIGASVGAQDFLQNLTSNINIEGLETTFDPVTGIASATGNVQIEYGGTEIKAGRADYNANTGDVMAREDVLVWKGDHLPERQHCLQHQDWRFDGEQHSQFDGEGLRDGALLDRQV